MDINETTPEANVRDNSQAGRYEITREGRTAILAYRRVPGAIALVHTFVPPPLRARGLAKRLVAFALADARGRGERVIPECPFVQAYIQKHPEEARGAE
jgi:predicted GNAT family acetyltransferase